MDHLTLHPDAPCTDWADISVKCEWCPDNHLPIRQDEDGEWGLYFLCPDCQAELVSDGKTLADVIHPRYLTEIETAMEQNAARFRGIGH